MDIPKNLTNYVIEYCFHQFIPIKQIISLTCSDGDGDTLSYSIASGNSGSDFALGSTVATANQVSLNNGKIHNVQNQQWK